LVRPAFEKLYQRENANFRDAGQELSAARDAQSLIEAFDRLTLKPDDTAEPLFPGIRTHLVERRQKIAGEQGDLSETLAVLTQKIEQAIQRTETWKLKEKGFEAIVRGFEKTYDRGQRAMEKTARKKAHFDDFHEWRKRVKYHWYHCRLLQNLWKPLMKARRDEAKHLAELLGDDHDYSLLHLLLTENADEFPCKSEVAEFRKVIARTQKSIRREAFSVGQRLYADKPKHLCRRLDSWWAIWRDAA
ncbi:MAG: CHAD domain-containing protein, partial [Planctomycetaceae bacterium]|nr:CHAD domain-containing protein [Planctomycetaceae bacterium]